MLKIVTVVDVSTFHFSCGELFGTVVVVDIAGGRHRTVNCRRERTLLVGHLVGVFCSWLLG